MLAPAQIKPGRPPVPETSGHRAVVSHGFYASLLEYSVQVVPPFKPPQGLSDYIMQVEITTSETILSSVSKSLD
jgi:hypothetical protein